MAADGVSPGHHGPPAILAAEGHDAFVKIPGIHLEEFALQNDNAFMSPIVLGGTASQSHGGRGTVARSLDQGRTVLAPRHPVAYMADRILGRTQASAP